jgi:hypothetical protein
MSEVRRVGTLEIAYDEAFERRAWAIQRAAWILVALVLFAALTGLFGAGPLSRAERSAGEGALRVEYERYWRTSTPLALRVYARTGEAKQDRLHIWLSNAYLKNMQVKRVTPVPASEVASEGRLIFSFDYAPPVQNGTAPLEVTFWLEPQSWGTQAGRIGIEGGPELAFTQFLFP